MYAVPSRDGKERNFFKMGLFGQNYENAGVGIAKNAPKKKGFFRFMEIFGRKFWKMIGLNLLYAAFFLPLVGAVSVYFLSLQGKFPPGMPTILTVGALLVLFAVLFGPATAGHTKILRNYVLEKPVFIIHDFFKTFRSEFKHSCLVGILDCFIGCCVAAAINVYPLLIEQTGSKIFYVFFAIVLSVGIVALMMNFYMFLMMISTTLSMKNIFKNSFFLSIVALKQNVITLLVFAAFVGAFVTVILFADLAVSFVVMALLPFIPASWIGLVICFNSYPIIQKYIINPYYEQRGEINPELLVGMEQDSESEDVVFEDMGGKETPIEKKKSPKSKKNGSGKNSAHKGKIIS